MKKQARNMLICVFVGVASMLAIAVRGLSAAEPGQAATPSDLGSFIIVGQCYRLVFSVPGAPDYKVRRLLAGGWIEAEVDAGPPSADREAVFVNTSQVITARQRRCSG